MVASSNMDPESVGIIKEYVHELMGQVQFAICSLPVLTFLCRFMVKERDQLFQSEYENASLQYQNISRS